MPTRFGLRIRAYVLMGDHYHLQIETLRPNLIRAIQWLNLPFSAWYNRLHHRRGSLFQRRFKAVLHDPQESALMINRYIHFKGSDLRTTGQPRVRPAILPAYHLGQRHAGITLRELGRHVGEVEYPALGFAIARF